MVKIIAIKGSGKEFLPRTSTHQSQLVGKHIEVSALIVWTLDEHFVSFYFITSHALLAHNFRRAEPFCWRYGRRTDKLGSN